MLSPPPSQTIHMPAHPLPPPLPLTPRCHSGHTPCPLPLAAAVATAAGSTKLAAPVRQVLYVHEQESGSWRAAVPVWLPQPHSKSVKLSTPCRPKGAGGATAAQADADRWVAGRGGGWLQTSLWEGVGGGGGKLQISA